MPGDRRHRRRLRGTDHRGRRQHLRSTHRGLPAFASGQFSQVVAPALPPRVLGKNNSDPRENGWYGEETLDVEAVHAHGARRQRALRGRSQLDDPDLLAAENDIVDHHSRQIVTNSWGDAGCSTPGSASQLGYTQTFLQAAAEGIGIFFSSGDNGDELANIGTRSTDFPASDPWVTAVGGTSLGDRAGQQLPVRDRLGHLEVTSRPTASGTRRLPATTCTAPVAAPARSSPQPWYQKGVVPSSISRYFGGKPGRAVPDIAALADPSTGMLDRGEPDLPRRLGQVQRVPHRRHQPRQPVDGGYRGAGRPVGRACARVREPAVVQASRAARRSPTSPTRRRRSPWYGWNYVNSVDASNGTTASLRTANQTLSLATTPAGTT